MLVSPRGHAVLADFGLSTTAFSLLASNMSTSFTGGTVRWMVPEIMNDPNAAASVEGDMWSFGMTTLVC